MDGNTQEVDTRRLPPPSWGELGSCLPTAPPNPSFPALSRQDTTSWNADGRENKLSGGMASGRPAARFFRATLLSKFSTPRELRWRDQGGDPRPWPDENRGQKSVVFYSRSAMGICYLHSGSDKQCKKCCNLHRIRDAVPPKRRQGTPP